MKLLVRIFVTIVKLFISFLGEAIFMSRSFRIERYVDPDDIEII